MQRERPIPFSAPMVRAVLDGTKTQTRRAIKNVPSWQHFGKDIMDWDLSGIHQEGYGEHDQLEGSDRWYLDVQTDVDDHSRTLIRCPYGAAGDRLWVREPWRVGKPHDHKPPRDIWPRQDDKGVTVLYEAGGSRDLGGRYPDTYDDPMPSWAGKYRPSMFMPRAFSRITLEVTGVRVERLQAISEADADAEGCERLDSERHEHDFKLCPRCGGTGLYVSGGLQGVNFGTDCLLCDTYSKRYRHLWESLNGAGSWDANPWVWAISFRRVTP